MIKDDLYGSLSVPVYNTVAFEFETAEAMEAAFCGGNGEHTYSRITNPTVEALENQILRLTGAEGVTALNSGMAAISNTFMTLASAGSNVVTSNHLFGNTYSLLKNTLGRFGVEVRFCDLTNLEEVRSRIDENTCAIFLEVITNPQLEVADLKQLSFVAQTYRVPLIADTTVIPPHVFHAKEFGVDIEVISSTKYISGGATSLGGLIIDYGVPGFSVKLRKEIHRNLGAYMTPQAAYMQLLGLETLEVRYARQTVSCLELAKRLEKLPQVESVNYTGMEDNRFYLLSQEQFGSYPGAMFTFDLSSREACFRFMNRLQVIHRATNLFDNKTLAIHPGSTIYGSFTEEQRVSMDVTQNTIRISVGLEDIEVLYQDIVQALG